MPKISQIRGIEFAYFKRNNMIRSTEELYTRFYATALQTIADARDLDKFDFDGQRELARKTAEMCIAVVKENNAI